ncbi:MAG: hypothetical protein V9E85_13795 [Candidatus Nanopelagicales bacterium]
MSTSNTKTSSALNGPRVPDLGDPEPTDGGFKVELKNYLDGFVLELHGTTGKCGTG